MPLSSSSSHLTALSSASWRSINPWSANFARGHDSTMWIIVRRSPHRHLSEEVRHHFCRFAAHNAVFVRKRFSNDHVRRGNSKPGCRTVGLDTSACRPQMPNPKLLTTEVVKSNHSGFLEWSRAGGWTNTSLWTGQPRWSFIFSTRTSVAALRHRLTGAILARTGSLYVK